MDAATVTADWVALDWGTTNLRVWAMAQGGGILAQAMSDKGMGKLSRDGFEPALLDLIGGWTDGPITVVACGMVGSRQGWVEAPYARGPCQPLSSGFVKAPTITPGLTVHVIPGILHGYMFPGNAQAYSQSTRAFSMKHALAILGALR